MGANVSGQWYAYPVDDLFPRDGSVCGPYATEEELIRHAPDVLGLEKGERFYTCRFSSFHLTVHHEDIDTLLGEQISKVQDSQTNNMWNQADEWYNGFETSEIDFIARKVQATIDECLGAMNKNPDFGFLMEQHVVEVGYGMSEFTEKEQPISY